MRYLQVLVALLDGVPTLLLGLRMSLTTPFFVWQLRMIAAIVAVLVLGVDSVASHDPVEDVGQLWRHRGRRRSRTVSPAQIRSLGPVVHLVCIFVARVKVQNMFCLRHEKSRQTTARNFSPWETRGKFKMRGVTVTADRSRWNLKVEMKNETKAEVSDF